MAAITKNKPFLALAAIIIVGLPLAYFFVVKPQLNSGSAEATSPDTQTVVPPEGVTLGVGPTYTMEERVLNLQGAGSLGRYLRLEVVLEFKPEDPAFYTLAGEAHVRAEEEFLLDLEPKAPLIEDAIISVVTGKAVSDVLTAGGKDDLKEEIAEAVNERIRTPEVVNVYFTQFVAQ